MGKLAATDRPCLRSLSHSFTLDFLIGIIGSKHDVAHVVLHTAPCFLDTTLHLAISEEKSGIHHAKEGTAFLGYVVHNYTSEKLLHIPRKAPKVVAPCRPMPEHIQLRIPYLTRSECCQRHGYGIYDTARASHKPLGLTMDDEEILLAYNAEMRGIAHYDALATGAKASLKKLIYMAATSVLKPLAGQHQTSVNTMAAQHRYGRDLVVTTTTTEGKQRRYTLFKLRNWTPPQPQDDVDKLPMIGTFLRASRNSLQRRLAANVCEFCGREGGYCEVHHVRKRTDVTGKARWEPSMIARQRKTLILCNAWHDLLHAGKLSKRQKKV